eukprot:symbB.v1.2.038169.t2/scaffold5856.1/size23381/1
MAQQYRVGELQSLGCKEVVILQLGYVKRSGFGKHCRVISGVSSEQILRAMALKGENADIRELLRSSEVDPALKKALAGVLQATSMIVGSEGHRSQIRLRGHAAGWHYGTAHVFCTPNLADGRASLLLQLHCGPDSGDMVEFYFRRLLWRCRGSMHPHILIYLIGHDLLARLRGVLHGSVHAEVISELDRWSQAVLQAAMSFRCDSQLGLSQRLGEDEVPLPLSAQQRSVSGQQYADVTLQSTEQDGQYTLPQHEHLTGPLPLTGSYGTLRPLYLRRQYARGVTSEDAPGVKLIDGQAKLCELVHLPRNWPLARLAIPLGGLSKQIDRLLEGYCFQILATNRDPDAHNGKVIQTATHLTWILAEYLADTIAWLMRSILDHASKILFDNDTEPLLTPVFGSCRFIGNCSTVHVATDQVQHLRELGVAQAWLSLSARKTRSREERESFMKGSHTPTTEEALPSGAAVVPVLNVSSRVFWLELDDKALLDSYSVLQEGILCDVFSQKCSAAWQGAPGQRLAVAIMLPRRQDADDWLNFMLSQKNLWPTFTTRGTLTEEISEKTFRKERRRLQAKHLWMEVKLSWHVLANRMYTAAPTGKSREQLYALLFNKAARGSQKNPYEEKAYRGPAHKAVQAWWEQCKEWMLYYKGQSAPLVQDLQGLLQAFRVKEEDARAEFLRTIAIAVLFDGPYTAGADCLADAIPESNRKYIRDDAGNSLPIGVVVCNWQSSFLLGDMIKIFLEEVLGYHAQIDPTLCQVGASW